jgi:predicted PurR-regulated permease PerM
MDILSFILGMSVVVVTAFAVVAVIGLVRVNKVKSQIDDIYHIISNENEETKREIGEIYRNMNEQLNGVNRNMDDRHDSLVRIMDSRLDKLENKISNNVPVKTKWHGYESLNK